HCSRRGGVFPAEIAEHAETRRRTECFLGALRNLGAEKGFSYAAFAPSVTTKYCAGVVPALRRPCSSFEATNAAPPAPRCVDLPAMVISTVPDTIRNISSPPWWWGGWGAALGSSTVSWTSR